MAKHQKKRNVGVVFEQLTTFVSDNLVKGENDIVNKALTIIEKHFVPGTELYREFRLFRALSDPRVSSTDLALRVLDEAKKAAATHNEKKLTSEKSLLIRDINHHLSESSFYDRRVENYKTYATVQTLLNSWRSSDPDPGMTSKYERTLIEWLTRPANEKKIVESVKIDPLAYKLTVKKFNEKWKHLTLEQRQLLNDFVSQNESDVTKRFEKIKLEVTSAIKKYRYMCESSAMKEKHDLVSKEIEKLDVKECTDANLSRFMTALSLKNELESNDE